MHPTARRCVWGAVVLWVAGAALVGFAPTLYDLADGWLGGAVDILVGFLQEALVVTGAVLVGAAVVIQALRGTRPSSVGEVAPGGQVTPVTGATPTAEPPAPVPATPLSGAVPTAEPHPRSAAMPVAPSSGAMLSLPPSSPVPAAPPLSSPVPTSIGSEGVPAGPVLGTEAAQVGPDKPVPSGRRPRARRSRG